MGAGEGIVIVETLLVLGLQLALPLALVAWGRRVAIGRPSPGWRIASWLPLVGLVVLPLGFLATIAMLVRGFAEVGNHDAATRATLLARSISEAMNFTALGVVVSFGLYVGCAIAFAYGTWGPPPRGST